MYVAQIDIICISHVWRNIVCNHTGNQRPSIQILEKSGVESLFCSTVGGHFPLSRDIFMKNCLVYM